MNALLNPQISAMLPIVLVILGVIFGGLVIVIRTIFGGWNALVENVKKVVVPDAVAAAVNAVKAILEESIAMMRERAKTDQAWQERLSEEVLDIRDRVARIEGTLDGMAAKRGNEKNHES